MSKQYSSFAIWLTHPNGRKQLVWEKTVEGDTLLDKFPSILKFEKYKNFTRMA